MSVTEKIPIPEQIKKALDGRTQRWLATELDMTEDALSRRMNGILQFTEDELKAIQERLKFKIK